MTKTRFVKLNEGWYAEPNACDDLKLGIDGHLLIAKFVVWEDAERWIEIKFDDCSDYQLHSWRAESFAHGEGMDRFTFSDATALNCDFHEIIGDSRFNRLSIPWIEMPGKPTEPKHFILMFRDYTFECRAGGWSISEAGKKTSIEFEKPTVQIAR